MMLRKSKSRADTARDTEHRITQLQKQLSVWRSKELLYQDQPEKLQFIAQQIESTSAEITRLVKLNGDHRVAVFDQP